MLAEKAYQKTIDFGAHPNVGALALMSSKKPTAQGVHFELAYLSREPAAIQGALKSSGQVGVVALMVLRHVFPERFDLLGLTEKLPSLRKSL